MTKARPTLAAEIARLAGLTAPEDLRVREFPGIPLSSGQGDDSIGEGR